MGRCPTLSMSVAVDGGDGGVCGERGTPRNTGLGTDYSNCTMAGVIAGQWAFCAYCGVTARCPKQRTF